MANEHSLIRSINTHIRKQQTVDVWKIKADFNNGVPDCWYCGNISDLWVEYKWIHRFPKRADTILDFSNSKQYLSALQQIWLEKKNSYGINTAVVIGSSEGCIFFPDLTWKKLLTARDFSEKAVPPKIIAGIVIDYCTKAGEEHEKIYSGRRAARGTT